MILLKLRLVMQRKKDRPIPENNSKNKYLGSYHFKIQALSPNLPFGICKRMTWLMSSSSGLYSLKCECV